MTSVALPSRRDLAFLGPLFVFMLVVFDLPLLIMLGWSVSNPAFTSRHYATVFQVPVYLKVLANTGRIAVVTTIVCVASRIPARVLAAWPCGPRPARRTPASRAAVLDLHPDPDVRVDRHPRQCRGAQPDAAGGWADRGATSDPLQRAGRDHRHRQRPAALLRPPALRVHAADRRAPPPSGRLPRGLAAVDLLARVLPADDAGGHGRRHPRVHADARLLHHAGGAGRRPGPDDRQHAGHADQSPSRAGSSRPRSRRCCCCW